MAIQRPKYPAAKTSVPRSPMRSSPLSVRRVSLAHSELTSANAARHATSSTANKTITLRTRIGFTTTTAGLGSPNRGDIVTSIATAIGEGAPGSPAGAFAETSGTRTGPRHRGHLLDMPIASSLTASFWPHAWQLKRIKGGSGETGEPPPNTSLTAFRTSCGGGGAVSSCLHSGFAHRSSLPARLSSTLIRARQCGHLKSITLNPPHPSQAVPRSPAPVFGCPRRRRQQAFCIQRRCRVALCCRAECGTVVLFAGINKTRVGCSQEFGGVRDNEVVPASAFGALPYVLSGRPKPLSASRTAEPELTRRLHEAPSRRGVSGCRLLFSAPVSLSMKLVPD
jgi:hypothetical protein